MASNRNEYEWKDGVGGDCGEAEGWGFVRDVLSLRSFSRSDNCLNEKHPERKIMFLNPGGIQRL